MIVRPAQVPGAPGIRDGGPRRTRRLLLSGLAALGLWGCAEGGGTAGPTQPAASAEVAAPVFADSALTAAVAEALATTSIDSLTSLTARDRGIADLTGIGQLARLRVLDLAGNRIADLTPLAGLDSLRLLDLTANEVSDVTPLAGLERLAFLLLAGNRITDIAPLLQLRRLEALELTGNPLAGGQGEHLAALAAGGVQVAFEGEVEPAEPPAPDFGVLTFAFRGRSRSGYRLNIWLGSTDGSPVRPLIDENAGFGRPVWSPDGVRIAFCSSREDELRQFWKVYVADADGSGIEAISDWDAGCPVDWSPDGSRLALVARHENTSADLLVVNPDGTDLRQLTDPHASLDGAEGDASWAPDGRRLAFKRRPGSGAPADSNGLLVIDVATGRVEKLTAEHVGWVSWSPAGEQILYSASSGGNEEIMVVGADGTGPVNLTSHPAQDSQPSWSPDGRRIVFVSNRDNPEQYFGDIFVMDADGSDVRKLTGGEARYMSPSWSPDGGVIAYFSDRSGVWSLHLVDPSGEFDLNVTHGDPEVSGFPGPVQWRPR